MPSRAIPPSGPHPDRSRCSSADDAWRAFRIASSALTLIGLVLGAVVEATTQNATPDDPALPQQLAQLVDTERAFAARARVIGWKEAFLEYFSDDGVGFAEGRAGLAKEQLRKVPDPPKDLQLLWEPRYGDIAASGDIGYLTGPAQTISPTRNKGQPAHLNYASVWKRERDGSFKVVMDVGVPTPRAAPFAPGFRRAPQADRFSGDYTDLTPPLGNADRVMNSALRSSQTQAYRGHLAQEARFHRPNAMPLVGERDILRYAAGQPRWSASESMFAEAARSGDLGYTWGSYAVAARGTVKAQRGFYTRVWTRARNGQWKVALDVLQPQ